MIRVIPINPDGGGLAKTLKQQYYKMGTMNILNTAEQIGSNFAATGVMNEYA